MDSLEVRSRYPRPLSFTKYFGLVGSSSILRRNECMYTRTYPFLVRKAEPHASLSSVLVVTTSSAWRASVASSLNSVGERWTGRSPRKRRRISSSNVYSPKVTTVHNTTAKITQGLSIPFSQVSAQGVNTVFIDAQLSLEVTPHITSDGSVLMLVHATNNQPDASLTGANGQPAISKQEATSQVLVKDGDTTVLGGIYVRTTSSEEDSVPFFGSIPFLGYFFKHTNNTETRQELLFFITPRILGLNGIKPLAAVNPSAEGQR